jgi:hypothetical protein
VERDYRFSAQAAATGELHDVEEKLMLTKQHRDELEDAELETSQVSEAMPSHMSGFKDHPM